MSLFFTFFVYINSNLGTYSVIPIINIETINCSDGVNAGVVLIDDGYLSATGANKMSFIFYFDESSKIKRVDVKCGNNATATTPSTENSTIEIFGSNDKESWTSLFTSGYKGENSAITEVSANISDTTKYKYAKIELAPTNGRTVKLRYARFFCK